MASGDPDASAGKRAGGLSAGAADWQHLDWQHLRAMTLADPALQREVLILFLDQSRDIIAGLIGRPENAAALAHTLKGAARAIGAFRVAAVAGQLEDAVRSGSDASQPPVRDLVSRLAAEIDTVSKVIARFLQDGRTS